MYKMYLVLGDWSKDGHNQSEKILVECNLPVEKIQQAYKDSCKLTGISFNINENFTGLKYDVKDYKNYDEYFDAQKRGLIATEYEDSSLNTHCLEQLKKFGFDLKIIYGDDYDTEDNEELYLDESSFTKLWFWFVKLSLPELQFIVVEDNIPVINGYWNKNLNVGFGYGLYS